MANPKIQLRHDTASNWESVNPVLLEGEVGIETDTNKMKVGNGTRNYNDLSYISGDSIDAYTKTETDDLLANKQDVLIAGDGISINTTLEGAMTPDWYKDEVKLDTIPDTIATPAVGVTNTYLPYNNQTFNNNLDNITITWETLYLYTSSATGSNIKLIGSDGELVFGFNGGYKGANSSLSIDSTINSSSILSQFFSIPYHEAIYIRNVFFFNKTTNTWEYKCINTNTDEIITSQTGTTTTNIIPTDSIVSIIMKNENGSIDGITVKTSSFAVGASTKEITYVSAKPDNTTIGFNNNGQLTYLPTDNVKSSTVTNIVQISQTDYDALETKDANTLYIIT